MMIILGFSEACAPANWDDASDINPSAPGMKLILFESILIANNKKVVFLCLPSCLRVFVAFFLPLSYFLIVS
jgi:hypothetical protein